MNTLIQESPQGRMTEQEYMRERVDDQLAWYNKKSTQNKNRFHRLQLLMLIAASSIPVLSLISSDMSIRILIAFIGAFTAVAAGANSLCRFQDLWIDYRATAETLQAEKYLFVTGATPYTKEDSYHLFVTRVESIILRENQGWQNKKMEVENQTDITHTENQTDDEKGGPASLSS